MKSYSIGKVSKLTGLSTKTIRFYEEKKVIENANREENGYRFFTDEQIDEIKIVKNARDLGLPINEIKKLIISCENGNCELSKERISESLDRYLETLSERMSQMKNLKDRLTKIKNEGKYCCSVIHQLSNDHKKGGEKNVKQML